MRKYQPFETWAQLLDHVNAEYTLYYHAPMDYQPALVIAVVRRDGRLRVTAPYALDSGSFTADVAHLPRFRRLQNRQTSSVSEEAN